MSDKVIAKLNVTKSALLTATAAAAVIGPLAMGFLDTSSLRAQTEQRAFDVASVKPNNSGDRQYGFNYEPGRFVGRNLPLLMYVALAYDLPFGLQGRVSGEPAWARSERFDIEGKADLPGLTAKGREVQMKLMLRTLLADRFQLRLRRETKDMPTYVLSVASNGVKLEKAPIEEKDCPGGRVDSSSCHVINGGMGRGMHGKAVDLPDIAQFASNFADRPVIDKTGLQGLYVIDTEGWQDMRPRPPRPDGQPSAEDLAMTDTTRPTLFMIFDRVGLKMDKQRGPVDYYTVEHAERPTAN